MPMWRCPHCATPQAETARCWVCHQSSTSCASCLNFRRSITAGIGYCALDRGRGVLRGQEIRPCWQPVVTLEGSASAQGSARAPGEPASTRGPELILVETLVGADPGSGRFWRDAEG